MQKLCLLPGRREVTSEANVHAGSTLSNSSTPQSANRQQNVESGRGSGPDSGSGRPSLGPMNSGISSAERRPGNNAGFGQQAQGGPYMQRSVPGRGSLLGNFDGQPMNSGISGAERRPGNNAGFRPQAQGGPYIQRSEPGRGSQFGNFSAAMPPAVGSPFGFDGQPMNSGISGAEQRAGNNAGFQQQAQGGPYKQRFEPGRRSQFGNSQSVGGDASSSAGGRTESIGQRPPVGSAQVCQSTCINSYK